MKLLLIGSASVHTYRYLKGIAAHVDTVHLVSNGALPEAYRVANLGRVLQVDFSLKALGSAGKIAALIDEIRPDIVHVHQANSVAWHALRALKGRSIPSVLTTWGSDVLLLPKQNALLKRMVAGNLAAASLVTSDSLYMAAVLRELAPVKRVEVLNFGMDALPAERAVAAKPKQVLSCRLHKPLYRVDKILAAWGQIEQGGRYSDWSLNVAASGPQTAQLKAQAAALGLQRIEFSGFVDAATLAGLYADSRVFVSVPESDGTSISLLEAMGHGCLPLLSNLPANLEWVIDGLNGRIAEDVDALVVTLAAALDEAGDDERLGEVAALNRRLVQQKALHVDNMRRFAGFYRELLGASAEG